VKPATVQVGLDFGYSISLASDGNTLAVGAIQDPSSATGINGNASNNGAPLSGAVHVFAFDGSAWTQQAYVKASNTGTGAQFGSSVSLAADGSTLAVGSMQESSTATGIDGDQANHAAASAGAAYVFGRTGAAWSQLAYVKASDTAAMARFGTAVSLSADGAVLAVGAPNEASNGTGIDGSQSTMTANLSGAVYSFVRIGGVWAQQHYIKATNADLFDQFGSTVSLSANGDSLAVGAINEAGNTSGIDGDQANNSAASAGAVYVY
jgi:hypothetical protein